MMGSSGGWFNRSSSLMRSFRGSVGPQMGRSSNGPILRLRCLGAV